MLPANPRRLEPLFDVTAVRSKALFLHPPAMATVRRGFALVVQRARRSLRLAASRSCERSRETPTGAHGTKRYQERPCCPVCAPPSGAAEQSGFQILLAASCLDSATAGRTKSRPISGRLSIVSVRTCDPSRRASAAAMASSKKSQTWAPRPERDRSSAAGRLRWRQASRNAAASSRQPALSKSTARKKQISPCSKGVDASDEGLSFSVAT